MSSVGFSPLLEQLIEALRTLPGVGAKSAQRIAFYLLERNRHGALALAAALQSAVHGIGHCRRCRTLSEHEICRLCSNLERDPALLCVVETPADLLTIESSGHFRGYYFVLMGRLSPLDGVGPQELGMDQLVQRFADPALQELILATNPTLEGEATAHYIAQLAQSTPLRVTRLAQGIPMGGELGYLDGLTLAHAFQGRREL